MSPHHRPCPQFPPASLCFVMPSNTHVFDDFSLGNDIFDPQIESCAFLESQSNQLYPNFPNFQQVTGQGGFQSHTQSNDTLHSYQDSSNPFKSNDLLEPRTNQQETTQILPSVVEGSLEKALCLANGEKCKTNVQMKGGISIGSCEKAKLRRQWSKDEDILLVQLMEKYGDKNWARIAENFPLRNGKQCRDRWRNGLRPNIMKNAWSEEEDMLLIKLHKLYGNRWADIARNMPGRSENSIKNHWNATRRRNFSPKSHHNLSKYLPFLLKDYIMSLTSSLPDNLINIQETSPVSVYGIPTSHPEQPESVGLDPQNDQSFLSFGVGNNPGELVVNNFDVDFDFDFDFEEVSSDLVDPNTEMDCTEMFTEISLDDFWLSVS